MEHRELSRYLLDKKEQIRKLKVYPRKLEIMSTKRFVTSVIGPRRAGKSFYLYDLILNKLKLSDADFTYLNFEDPELTQATFKDLLKAISIHEETCGSPPKYIFLDEIQILSNWDRAVRGLQERQQQYIFLSGSSSKLLSKEIATSLRGRTLSYLILPLSFREYLQFGGFEFKTAYTTSEENKIKNALREYLKFGGFPDIFFERQFANRFFKEYIDLVIFKDIIERHKIKNVFVIKFLVKSLLASFSKNFSIHNIFNTLKSQGAKISKKTIYNYTNYLEDAFFVFFVKKFSYSAKDMELSIPKVYINDPGIINSIGFNFSENFGRLMENAVFLELKRSQNVKPTLEIYYYKTTNEEIDFVIKEGTKITQLIQICYDMDNAKTKDRELKALIKASKTLHCNNLSVITWDYEGIEKLNNKTIKFMPLWKWLLS